MSENFNYRQLTDKEKRNIPDWATHYFIVYENMVVFESLDYFQNHADGKLIGQKQSQLAYGISPCAIILKEFDIKNHEWSGGSSVEVCDDTLWFCPGDLEVVGLSKGDFIALAKHFKLTMDDLK